MWTELISFPVQIRFKSSYPCMRKVNLKSVIILYTLIFQTSLPSTTTPLVKSINSFPS